VTTLIAGLALLAFGSGPVRGFAVVHCLGILTSMFSGCSSRAAWSTCGTAGKKSSRACQLVRFGVLNRDGQVKPD